MLRRVAQSGPGRTPLRAWPLVLAALAVMAAMVVVATRAGDRADRSRQAHAVAEHLLARSEELSAMKSDAMLQIHARPGQALLLLPGYTARGLSIYNDLNRSVGRLQQLTPGAESDHLAADVRRLYAVGMLTLRRSSAARSAETSAANELFTPALDDLDGDVERLVATQQHAADRAHAQARVAILGSFAGGLLSLLVLTMSFERIRRRSAFAEEVRAVERRSEERIRALVEHASDVVTVVDRDLVVRWQAASVHRMLGIEAADVVGHPLASLVHPEDTPRLVRGLARCTAGERGTTVAVRLRAHDGSWVHVEAIVSNRLEDPAVEGLLLSMRDVGERKALEDRLRHQAYHDPLTGLANRTLFEERLRALLSAEADEREGVAVLFLDLDDFKTINDSLGHAAGDELLRGVGTRIASVLRPGDVPSRQGGDEFAVLLHGVDDERAAVAVAERILDALRDEFVIEGRRLAVTGSIGLALDTGGLAAEELLRNADIAMYGAKEQGKGAIRVFEDQLHRRVVDRLELGAELPRAIAAGEFVLEYQPIVDLADERIMGVEALVRWEHPVRGRLSPLQFISLAEETGAIVPLGLWVLRTACAAVRDLQMSLDQDGPPLYVSVNVSTKQLRDPGFPHAVEALLAETGLAAESLVLELTESLLVHDREAIMVQLEQLKALGLRLAVDDFGTGYSVLSYLQEFPIDLLKIDKSFVDDIHLQPEKAKLVAGIVQLSDSLHLEVIAEGIEETAQADQLRAMHSPLGQGYLFSRPVPMAALAELLSSAGPAAHRVR